MTDKRLQAKIRKLLALANDPAASPQEAETAARQAAKLMAAHDISLADLTEQELRQEWDMTVVEAQGTRPGKKNPQEVPTWIGIIAWGVKTYCRVRLSAGRGVVYFKGPREDVELAKWLHELLLAQCYTGSKGMGMSAASQFRNGFAGVIQQRLKKMADTRDQSDTEDAQVGNGNALVVIHEARQRIMNELYGDESSGRKSNVASSHAGQDAGRKAHIPTARPIGAAPSQRRLA